VDAHQDTHANPFGMDEDCRHCPALCESRERVVHGYGDVGADFLFVDAMPSEGADADGVPFRDEVGEDESLFDVLADLGLCAEPESPEPALQNTYLTSLTRCHHPDRGPTDEEVLNCEGFLTAEVRMINPEILVPVGERALAALAEEYTTTPASDLSLPADHATSIRGRGFELVPMVPPNEMTADERDAFVAHFEDLFRSDYRQTKGRRGR
jgi:uracil-DNA glycosylase family 4